MTRSIPIFAAAVLLLATSAAASPASAATRVSPAREFVPGTATRVSPAREFVPGQVVVKLRSARRAKTVALPPGIGVRRAAAALSRKPRVAYATPNYLATASGAGPSSAAIADDPGLLTTPPGPPGGWMALQWNFLPSGPATGLLPVSPGGIDAIGAWQNLIAASRPGASGITVAVLDTGIAYRSKGARFRRSPDFSPAQFVPGYDFVERDWLPLDENGHGTHVAGTIAEKTDNGIGLTGLAYRAKLMPVRVLDRHGVGQASRIAEGIRFAVAHGADVINMSFNFGCNQRVPGVEEELRRAYREGVVTVASIGNLGSEGCISPPATGPHTIGVGGTTEGGCLGRYSRLPGKGVDVLAPGGGTSVQGCPSVSNRSIYQVTLNPNDPSSFGEPATYIGTSMAAAHVSGVAAMTLASGVLKPSASPTERVREVTERLRNTARDLGLPSGRQGAGLIDAAKATEPPP